MMEQTIGLGLMVLVPILASYLFLLGTAISLNAGGDR